MNDASFADILKIYLGQNAGEAVLAGNMSRGESLKVTAAILIVDIRGSTPLLQKLGTDSYIDIINKLFDIVTPHVRANDGEVPQFTGDGMLAVFPESAEAKAGGFTCPIAIQNAYTAAVGADKATLDGDLPASLGFGLSYGPVDYGNVGAEDRLTFTVISAEVSRADRLQSLCPLGDSNVAISGDCAAHLPDGAVRSIGHRVLKGFTEETEIFVPG